METTLTTTTSTPELALRLVDMAQQLDLLRSFFAQVMVRGEDYGVIPGTDRPTLFKAGAEKLLEFYAYAGIVQKVEVDEDRATGYYKVRAFVAITRRDDPAIIIAGGVGEANTYEDRYRYRWFSEAKLPAHLRSESAKASLHQERRKSKFGDGQFVMYRVENDDPWTLHNTILKMARKRALVDGTLAATRSSGLFTQDTEDLAKYLADAKDVTPAEAEDARDNAPAPQRRAPAPARNHPEPEQATDWTAFWASLREKGITNVDLHAAAGVKSIKDVPMPEVERIVAKIMEMAEVDNLSKLAPASKKKLMSDVNNALYGDPGPPPAPSRAAPATPQKAVAPSNDAGWLPEIAIAMNEAGIDAQQLHAYFGLDHEDTDDSKLVAVVGDWLDDWKRENEAFGDVTLEDAIAALMIAVEVGSASA